MSLLVFIVNVVVVVGSCGLHCSFFFLAVACAHAVHGVFK